ncbi:MAG: AMP-binding protein, partial [Rhizobiales bacterium]|nr:AMP-binding protein [Hyphomicrobiales bacterium]
MAAGDLFALVEPVIARVPNAPAIVTIDGQILSYDKLGQTIAAFADHARHAGIGSTDRVAIDIANEAIRLCLIFALSRIGAVAVPSGTPEEILGAGIELSAIISNRLEYRASPRTVAFHQGWFVPVEIAVGAGAIQKDTPCLLMASSGSTGQKKFMEFHLGMLQQRLDWDDGILLHPSANRLLTLSIATDFGFRNALRTLRHGGLLVGPAGSPQATIGRLDEYGIGQLVTTPSILVDLVEMIRLNPRPLPKLESIITVGGPIAGAYAAEAARLFNSTVTNVYGSTETGIVSLAT